MLRRTFRRGLKLGLLVGVAFAVVKFVQSRRSAQEPAGAGWGSSDAAWTPPPAPAARPAPADTSTRDTVRIPPAAETSAVVAEAEPEPPAAPAPAAKAAKATKTAKAAKAAKPAAGVVAWVEPSGSTCPTSHPVKAKLSSHIFHLPGMFAYERTRPDRCYVDEEAAVGDGFTRAKR